MYMCDLRKRKGIEYFLIAEFFHEDFSSFIIISQALDINIFIYLDAKTVKWWSDLLKVTQQQSGSADI